MSEISKKNEFHVDQKSIASNLASLLAKEKITPAQLAFNLNIPVMTIRRLLSGETEDPRISTLKIIAEYFNISVDALIENDPDNLLVSGKSSRSYIIPKITWENLRNINSFEREKFKAWNNFQSVSLSDNNTLSNKSFALESRPSMYPRFPRGSSFIIDPEVIPEDGDIVLIKIKSSNDFTLRELLIDPPDWKLLPLISDSKVLIYSKDDHEILGVSLLTMVYNPKISS